MKLTHSLILLFLLFITSRLIAAPKGVKVIYGEDNRVDVVNSTNASFIELSRSTAAMIPNGNLKRISYRFSEIKAPTLKERGICESERFSNQLTGANCSGFLVGPDLLVTAGHCITKFTDCLSNKWVFDYKVDHEEQNKMEIPVSNIYSCRRIISRSLNTTTKEDYALIKLSRPVRDRHPLKFRTSGKVAVGDPLVVIGHPTGLPTKIADGAQVRRLQPKFFIANLDTYGGNSGSAVFNVNTLEVEGILVRGEQDYVYNSARKCDVSKICKDEGCRGEDVTYITNIPELKSLPQ
jgi:V8-like Glu-specific endopeptidase